MSVLPRSHWEYRVRSLRVGMPSATAGSSGGTALVEVVLDEEGRLLRGAEKVHGYSQVRTGRCLTTFIRHTSPFKQLSTQPTKLNA